MNSFDTNLGSLLSGGVSSDRLKEIIGSHDVRTPRQAVATQTGILSLDLGLIGIPPGIMEVYGPRSVGKTPMLAAILAFAQKTGMEGCFVATEPFDKDRMTKIGVDLDNLPVLRGGDSRLFQEMVSFLEHNERGILVIDSFTGLRPREDMEPDEWNSFAFDLLSALTEVTKLRSCVVVSSQVRNKRTMGSRSAFAGKTDSASKRIADLFSTRLALDRKDVSDDTYTMVVDVVANVLSMPHAVIELPALKETGVDLQRDFLRAAVATGVVVKKGPKHYFDNLYLGAGENNAVNTISYDPELQLSILARIMQG